jgi:hypothetical protein
MTMVSLGVSTGCSTRPIVLRSEVMNRLIGLVLSGDTGRINI